MQSLPNLRNRRASDNPYAAEGLITVRDCATEEKIANSGITSVN